MVTLWKEKEFLDELETMGVDTCCFMGCGYRIEEYLVGQEFYFPYSYHAQVNGLKQNSENALDVLKINLKTWNIVVTDRYRLVGKYKYIDNILKNCKRRIESITVKNLRTNEVITLNDEAVDAFYFCMMADPFISKAERRDMLDLENWLVKNKKRIYKNS